MAVDVADPESVQALVEATLAAFGGVHMLVNNAAIQISKMVEDTTPEEWNRQMAVNVGGGGEFTSADLDTLERRGADDLHAID